MCMQSPAMCVCSWAIGDTELLAIGNDKGEVTVIDVSKGLKEKPKPGANAKIQKKRCQT